MDDAEVLKQLAALIADMAQRGALQIQADRRDALVRTTVVPSTRVPQLLDMVTELMGPAVKPAGEGAFWKNWFDPFVKAVGGIQKDQSLFRKPLVGDLSLYCAFWPWASDATRTSLRIGICCGDDRRKALEAILKAAK